MSETKKRTVNPVIRLALILFLVSAITSGVLGFTNYLTKDRIAKINEEAANTAMQAVLPYGGGYEKVEYTGSDSQISSVYKAGGEGWVVEVVTSGSQGDITMFVGVSAEGKITGISLTSSKETVGLGDIAAQASAKGEAFRSQFVGKSGNVAVTKDGGEIDALTGATVTSRAVCKGATAALQAAAELG